MSSFILRKSLFCATCAWVSWFSLLHGVSNAQNHGVSNAQYHGVSNAPNEVRCEPRQVAPIHRAKHSSKPKVDWTTLASTYTHNETGQRVDQFAQPVDPLVFERPDYVKSGYRHTRSSLQVGFSADHYHVTEQWGNPVQSYGQWRYPFRPYSVPYDMWGPQLPQFLGNGTNWSGRYPLPWPPGAYAPNPLGFNSPNAAHANANSANGSMPMPNRNMDPPWQAHPGVGPNYGYRNANPWDSGPSGGIQVGPWNALPEAQDEYYQQSPLLKAN